MIISKKCRNENNQQQSLKVCVVILKGKFRGSPIVFSESRISLIWSPRFRISLILNSGFGIESMPKITIGITGLPEILGRDQGIEERYWEPSVSDQWRRLCDCRQLFLFCIFVYSTLSINISLFHFRFILLLNTASTRLVQVNPGEALPTTSRPQSILSFKYGTRRLSGRGP